MLEVLVALGIVVAVSAVLVPWTFGWLGGRELDSAEDRLAMHLMMARAAAREEGKPVEVVAGDGGVEARWLAEAGGADDETVLDASLFRESPEAARGFGSSIDADWAAFRLPAGVQIDVASATAPSGRDGAAEEVGAPRDPAVGAQTLAIFLPDGTVIMAPTFMLRTDAGAVRRMRVDGATGRPKSVERPVADDSAGMDESSDLDALENGDDGSAEEDLDVDGRGSDRRPMNRSSSNVRPDFDPVPAAGGR